MEELGPPPEGLEGGREGGREGGKKTERERVIFMFAVAAKKAHYVAASTNILLSSTTDSVK